jgi:dihydrofolate reductase
MDLSLIWAMSENRVIGRAGGLPWRLPLDMRHFMDTTMGKPVIMGRKTFESMKAPLPGRANIVLTRDPAWQRHGIVVVNQLQDAIRCARDRCQADAQSEAMVIGGADVYARALPQANRLYITHVHATVEGDVVFPTFDLGAWQQIETRSHAADERHFAAFTIATYVRA